MWPMNHGNSNSKQKVQQQNIDVIIERLNKRIGKLLGKNGKQPQGKKVSNLTFSLIIISFSILLWLTTGFYYLSENQFGLILCNGKIEQVVKGMKVGFTTPYPFGDIETVDGTTSEFIDLNKLNLNANGFIILARDLNPILVDAKFNYQIVDPALVFKTSLQKQNNIDDLVAWRVEIQLRNYFAAKLRDDILKSNLIVTAGEIKNIANQDLSAVGIKLVKFSINSLQDSKAASPGMRGLDTSIHEPLIATQLLQQAALYRQNKLSQTKVAVDQFNQLLPQYKKNPQPIVEQMYYDTLEAIPYKGEQYPLMALSLSDLLTQAKLQVDDSSATPAQIPLRERHYNREVNRSRDLDGGE